MPHLLALSSITHDGKEYVAGKKLNVTEEQAQALIEAGVAKPTDGDPEQKS